MLGEKLGAGLAPGEEEEQRLVPSSLPKFPTHPPGGDKHTLGSSKAVPPHPTPLAPHLGVESWEGEELRYPNARAHPLCASSGFLCALGSHLVHPAAGNLSFPKGTALGTPPPSDTDCSQMVGRAVFLGVVKTLRFPDGGGKEGER